MLIFEVENSNPVDNNKLIALVSLLSGMTDDADSKKQISATAFVNLAKKSGINLNINANEIEKGIANDSINNLISSEPLRNLQLTYDPISKMIKFKGIDELTNQKTSPEQAENIVASKAKASAKSAINKKL
jgi:CRISPR/Cas system Type II protein with McrA/HNH and RuvC-like nuclease domain